MLYSDQDESIRLSNENTLNTGIDRQNVEAMYSKEQLHKLIAFLENLTLNWAILVLEKSTQIGYLVVNKEND